MILSPAAFSPSRSESFFITPLPSSTKASSSFYPAASFPSVMSVPREKCCLLNLPGSVDRQVGRGFWQCLTPSRPLFYAAQKSPLAGTIGPFFSQFLMLLLNWPSFFSFLFVIFGILFHEDFPHPSDMVCTMFWTGTHFESFPILHFLFLFCFTDAYASDFLPFPFPYAILFSCLWTGFVSTIVITACWVPKPSPLGFSVKLAPPPFRIPHLPVAVVSLSVTDPFFPV